MLAPADVPPTAAPRACASVTARPNAVPVTTPLSFNWLPPVMKIPVAWFSGSMKAGSSASSRFSGRTPTTLAAPSAANSAEYTSTTSGPSAEAVGTTTIRALEPPAASTNS